MKVTLILLLPFCMCASASSYSQQITLKGTDIPIKKVFATIKKQTGYVVWGSSDLLRQLKPVSVDVNRINLEAFLGLVLRDQPFEYEIAENTIILSPSSKPTPSSPQSGNKNLSEEEIQFLKIMGVVRGTNGEPLPGVNITVRKTGKTVQTSDRGEFSLDAEIGDELKLTLVGYQTEIITIRNPGELNIVLKEDYQKLDEVVMVGYGSMKKSDLTGAVASVKADQLNTMPVGNAVEALSGKVAGVDVGAITRPGESPNVTIRGVRSINAANNPLFVVDGIPRNAIDDIPVNEIQSVEVLKDAVAASVYGSRGANGVILITTKSANKNISKTVIDVDAYAGINSVNLPHFMDGETFIEYRRNVARYAAYGVNNWSTGAPLTNQQVFAEQEIPAVESGAFTDWKTLLYNKHSLLQEYNLNISSSTEKNQVRFSAGFRNDEGYYPGSDDKRLTLALKLDQQLFPFLRFGINSRYTSKIGNEVDPGLMMGSGTNTYNALQYLNPLIRAYDDNGEIIENVVSIYANPLLDYSNPFVDKTTKNRLFNLFYVKAQLAKNLTFTSNFGYEIQHDLQDIFYGRQTTKRYIVRESEGAFASKRNETETNLTWDNILNYTLTKGDHRFDATLVSSIQNNVEKTFSAQGTGLPDDVLGNWNMEQLNANIVSRSGYQRSSIASGIARVQYGYKERYLFNASVRSDGASVLSEGNKWSTFPAVSGAWVISNENFYQSGVLTTLKVRVGHGTVGNAAIKPYETLAGVAPTKTNFGNLFVTGYSLAGLVNKSLGWEISRTTNIGLDWALFGGRINGYVEAYKTKTTDLLFKRSLPHLTGSTEIWQNIGASSNTGLEMMVASNNIKSRNFSWTTDVNFSTNKTRIEKLITDADMVDKNLFIGKPWNIYYDYNVLGIWQIEEADEAAKFATFPGFAKLEDISGPEGKPDGSVSDVYDRVIRGQKDPKWMLYVRNTFKYKKLSLSFGLNGKFGHMIQMSGNGFNNLFPLDVFSSYWTPDNPSGKYPLITSTGTNLASYWRLRKGDYINLQEVTLGYGLKMFNQTNVNISFQARNPFFIYKAAKDVVDPSTPNSDWSAWKSYVLKLNFSF